MFSSKKGPVGGEEHALLYTATMKEPSKINSLETKSLYGIATRR